MLRIDLATIEAATRETVGCYHLYKVKRIIDINGVWKTIDLMIGDIITLAEDQTVIRGEIIEAQ